MIGPPDLFHAFTAQQHANECSLKIAWILGQHQEQFNDGGMGMECMNAVAETLLDGKPKDEQCEKIRQIPMSRTSAARKSEILAEDVLTQLDEAIQGAPCIAFFLNVTFI
jgi:hypothetical protein